MSKKNGKSRGRRETSTGEATHEPAPQSEAAAAAATTPRKRLTVPERLASKSSNIYELVKDVAAMATFYGAGPEIVAATQNLLVEVDSWRGKVKEIVDGGWQPVVRGELKDLTEGDKISVAKEAKELYSYIPEGVSLAVGKIERSENGRIRRILLADERLLGDVVLPDGALAAYGWAQLSHLERR
jgi:hypothetical protein